MIDELSIIARYFRPLAGAGAFNLTDDAGRLRVPPGYDLVVTADMLAMNVHFLDDPPRTIAQKALRVNLSDLAAKGAEPLAYTFSAAFPPDLDEDWLAAFCDGLRADHAEFGIELLGGDTVTMPAGAPVLSITAFGVIPEGAMVHRFTGRPGDVLYVSGTIGDAVAGLALRKGRPGAWDRVNEADKAELMARYCIPQPRTHLSGVLRNWARAAMDVSDGLVGDCDKLAAASGCTALLEAERVPVAAGLRHAAEDPEILAQLITGGDDYEILAAIPPEHEADFRRGAEAAGVPVTRIGVLRVGAGPSLVRLKGKELPLPARSYVHGMRSGSARAKPL